MRLSASPDSPHYDPHRSLYAKVFLDGKQVSDAFEADDGQDSNGEGWVRRYVTDPATGAIATFNSGGRIEFMEETLRGRVEIYLPTAPTFGSSSSGKNPLEVK
jgi:hypothetical protein